jgi:glycosyltransferase involved in cell wall biosynthesis
MRAAVTRDARNTYVVGCDAKTDIRVFSGSTHHLAEQGRQDGLFAGMINLYPRGISAWNVYARAAWWKLQGRSIQRSGFKFTESYLDTIWRNKLRGVQSANIVNNFQLFGPYFLRSYHLFGIEPYVYIDGTLDEYFGSYEGFDTSEIDRSTIRRAFDIEREGYALCRQIVVMSARSAANITQHYKMPADKLHVIPPGANIPERLLQTFDAQPPRNRSQRTLIVGFIGLYPERKGLPTVAEAVRLARRAGYDIRLHIIGRCPLEIAQQDGVTYHGMIDKSVDMDRFLRVIRDIDIGCMLSHAELTGIALLEFLRMGKPVIASDVGGIPDIVQLGAGELIAAASAASELAERLARLIDDPEQLRELQSAAWHRRRNASWRRVVRELKNVLNLSSHAGEA